MTDVGNIKINHCYFNGCSILERKSARYIPICIKLQNYLVNEYIKRNAKQNKVIGVIELTYGIDPDNHIEAIAVVSEKDNFNRKIGTKIVVGRIKRMRRDKLYDYNNPFVYKLN